MQNLVQRLDLWLQKNRTDYYEHLLPGATEEQVHLLAEKLNLELPQQFQDLLKWKNGQDDDGKLLDNYTLLSCEAIFQSWSSLKEYQEEGIFESENWWNPKWVPFLYDFTGNYCCIDTEGSFGGKAGQILEYWHDSNDRTVIHKSFYKWLETVVLAMEKGIIYYGGDDYQNYLSLLRENNPGYPIKISV